VRRVQLYGDAGADCVFVPGFPGPDADPAYQHRMIGDLVARLDGVPLNLLSSSTSLPVAELRALGVRRLSVGSALYRLGMAAAREAMAELLRTGRQDALGGAESLSYAELLRALPGGPASP
jgi:2-methylisocitrate lyase-like PEP mutase family enzyme